MVNDIKVRIDQNCYVMLPVTLLESMTELVLSTLKDKKVAGRGLVKSQPKKFTVKWDEDGLLVVRGIDGQDRYTPVLTSNTGRWIRRTEDSGLIDIKEIELDTLI